VAYLITNTSKFKDFVINVINMFRLSKIIVNYNPQIFTTADLFKNHITKS